MKSNCLGHGSKQNSSFLLLSGLSTKGNSIGANLPTLPGEKENMLSMLAARLNISMLSVLMIS